MRVAIATNDGENIAERAAMAKYYYIYEGNERKEVVDNPYVELGRGRGRAVANMLLGKGIDVFVAGIVGENVKDILSSKGIRIVEKTGKINDILKSL